MTYYVQTFGGAELARAATLAEARELVAEQLPAAECEPNGCPDQADMIGVEAWVDPTLDDDPHLQAELALYIMQEACRIGDWDAEAKPALIARP